MYFDAAGGGVMGWVFVKAWCGMRNGEETGEGGSSMSMKEVPKLRGR